MKRKFIIHYDEELNEVEILKRVLSVVSKGRISRARGFDQFCFVSVFSDNSLVYAKEKRSETTDTFVITKEEE